MRESLPRRTSGSGGPRARAQHTSNVRRATNDVFLRVFTRLTTFDGDEDGFRSWMFTIAHHLMVDELRRAARRPKIADVASIEEHVPGGDAEEDALAGMGRQRIEALLARLSTDQRAVVLLRVVEDLSRPSSGPSTTTRPAPGAGSQDRACAPASSSPRPSTTARSAEARGEYRP
ncbi:hypothetical protein BH20ACT1_BH20ACT1_10800 [soil metagenome]